ncbi:hypothetical protein LINGRAHAP2_LOCUS20561 [Linum grandiflorum]
MREEYDELDGDEDDPLCPSIPFIAAEKAGFRRVWCSTLVVRGLGRRVPYLPLARRLNYLWARHGPLQISDLRNGCFLVRFKCGEDYEGAISGGPWTLGDTYLTVHHRYKGFNPWKSEIKNTMVWVTLPYLPIEFYNPVVVHRIASRIGKPIRVDRATKEGARGKFARICVEVDLSKPLLPTYKVEGVKYFIEYEGLHEICIACGFYGALVHRCKCQQSTPAEPDVPDPMMETTP